MGVSKTEPTSGIVKPVVDDEAVEEKEFDDPIKIQLHQNTDARKELNKYCRFARDEGNPYNCAPCVGTERQVTNIVIRSLSECIDFPKLLERVRYSSVPPKSMEAIERVEDEFENQLLLRGYETCKSDRDEYQILRVEGVLGDPPSHLHIDEGDLVDVDMHALGWDTNPGEKNKVCEVVQTGCDKVILNSDYKWNRYSLKVVEYPAIDGRNEEKMEDRRIDNFIRERRSSADWDKLAELAKEHCRQELERMEKEHPDEWKGVVPIERIEFEFNPRLSYIRGKYYPMTNFKGRKIELSKTQYIDQGLDAVLQTARHELIHAWQDHHPDGHPPDTHKHHGHDFDQWLEPLNTE